jgi:hypothetical protein
MSAAQEASNKAIFRRLQDAINTGDAELVSQTIEEVFDPDVKQHTPFEATGAQTLRRWCSRGSIGPSPTSTLRSRT